MSRYIICKCNCNCGRISLLCHWIRKTLSEKFSDLLITDNSSIIVRGELIMYESIFKKKYVPLGYNVARNTVVGQTRNLNVNIASDIHYIVYELITDQAHPQMSPSKQFEKLSLMGFDVVPYINTKSVSIESLTVILSDYRKKLDYFIDGLVIYSDNPYKRVTSGFPKHVIAFKIQQEGETTRIKSIVWTVGRTLRYTPVLMIEPVNINGTIVSKVSGQNARWVFDNRTGKDAIVKVIKSGEVIPYVSEVLKPSDDIDIPVDAIWDEGKTFLIVKPEDERSDG